MHYSVDWSNRFKYESNTNGLMVKLVITMDFESIVPSSSLGKTSTFARLAQLVERNALNVVVEGSSPSVGAF